MAVSRERMMEKRTRLTYLQEIDRQEEKRCDNCKNADSVKASKCSCPAAVRIRQIGQLLEGKKVEPTKKEEPKMVAEQKELTVAMIDDLRAKGESWELIGKRMGVTGVTAKNRYERMKGEQPKPELKEVKQRPSVPEEHEYVGQLEDRINELTKQLQRSKESYEELADDLRHQRKINGQHVSHIENLGKTIDDLRAELESAKPLTVDEPDPQILQQNAFLQDENAKLREQVRRLQDQLDYAREDQAAAEDYLCEKASHERKLSHALMDYIRGLEVGVR